MSGSREQLMQKMRYDEVLSFFSANKDDSFNISQIAAQFPSIQHGDLTKVLQQMLLKANIRQITEENSSFTYKYIPESQVPKFAGLNTDHHVIYNLIERKGNLGIWRRDLKRQSGFDERKIMSIMNELEARQLVKTTPSIQDKKLKLYILFDLVPSAEITGGIWYLDGKFDTQFVEHLLDQMTRKVTDERAIALSSLRTWVRESGISKVRLSDDDCAQAIKALIHSGSVIQVDENLVPGPQQRISCPITKLPCCQCPLFDQCEPDGVINPVDCPYLNKMTELF